MVGGDTKVSRVSPAAKNSSLPATIAFAEAFVGEVDGAETARQRADELGVDVISGGVAATLTFLTRTVAARTVAEIGTGTGVSGLALLAGMVPDGVLTSIDAEVEHQIAAREVFTAQEIPSRRFRLIAGQPLTVLPKLTDGAYDLVYIDGDPLEYVEYVAQAERLLRPGGILVIHHALWRGLVADEHCFDDEPLIVREALVAVQEVAAFTSALLPLGDGLLVAVKS